MKNGKWLLLFLPFFLFADAKNELIKFYKKHYPNIKIISIYTQKPFPKKYKKISFKFANYKSQSGNLIIDNKYYFYRIKAKLKVYTANRVIKKNEPVFSNVSQKEINFRNFYSPPLIKIDKNLIASKVISKNAVITKNNTKIKPDILKGDSINVVFKGNGIEIYSKGKALNDANINDKIKVEINHKIYEGVVDKNNIVEIK
ncbi:flagella basal body P-ring formation protein FlgA [Lebetimonas natsushimae]|uniref:Flagella basal body P-ring formation protein FlgA n=1 Tax=Lebetimonas natsushimae TaxID=1936991 RepID=A0A292YF44_9BACT|nr:flagellar basal body P-ring formation chaperone FlgA [Lebetimonas natsushimae]GAX88108.1 flagella basal body P-ring formation protein FlgA [Lebetimonas natsushimae]